MIQKIRFEQLLLLFLHGELCSISKSISICHGKHNIEILHECKDSRDANKLLRISINMNFMIMKMMNQ